MLNYKNILYATDLHETCQTTLERLIVFATKFEANIIVLHVIKPISGMYGYTAGIASDVDLEIENKAISQLERLVESVGLDKARGVIRKGQYSNAIIEHADEEGVDAIVLNGHTHNVFARMGSTEDCVVNNAHCDVIVLR
jgi:universal stress protein A